MGNKRQSYIRQCVRGVVLCYWPLFQIHSLNTTIICFSFVHIWMHHGICFSTICVNNIEYVKLKTHGKFTRMDSIALLKWFLFVCLTLHSCKRLPLQRARSKQMFTFSVRSQYDFILKCVKELFFAWVQFTRENLTWGLDPTAQHTQFALVWKNKDNEKKPTAWCIQPKKRTEFIDMCVFVYESHQFRNPCKCDFEMSK